MMYQLLLVGILVTVGYGYFTWSQEKISAVEKENVVILAESESLRQTVKELEERTQKQSKEIANLTVSQQEQELEIQRYLSIFARHDLNKLASAKPGLIETRVNNGTRQVFETITNETISSSNSSDAPRM